MTNLVVFNVYWYLIVSMIVTLWALTDILARKGQHFLFRVWDYAILMFGTAAWWVSIYTFQRYTLGTLSQKQLEDLDSWLNVWLTMTFLILNLFFYLLVKKEKKKCA